MGGHKGVWQSDPLICLSAWIDPNWLIFLFYNNTFQQLEVKNVQKPVREDARTRICVNKSFKMKITIGATYGIVEKNISIGSLLFPKRLILSSLVDGK